LKAFGGAQVVDARECPAKTSPLQRASTPNAASNALPRILCRVMIKSPSQQKKTRVESRNALIARTLLRQQGTRWKQAVFQFGKNRDGAVVQVARSGADMPMPATIVPQLGQRPSGPK
jgi:hypothetical protein